MKRFKNVLVVAREDFTTALERARRLALANRARLTLVDVVDELPAASRLVMSADLRNDMQNALQQSREAELEAHAAPLREDGLEVVTEVRAGRAFLEVIRRVLEYRHDLVIKPALGTGKVTFGSLGLHLMRKCPCPVWIVKADTAGPYAGILAAVDPDPERPESAQLDHLVLDLATSLAAREGSPLHVVHAWRMIGEETLRGGVNRLSSMDVEAMIAEEGRHHGRWLDALLADYQGAPMQVHLEHGPAQRVIPRVARAEGVELIVMGSVARSGIAGYFVGNTAESVFTEVDCSVLTVKPEGFVSPVTLPAGRVAAVAGDGR